jgi:DNA-nicking Smr family endonuclease
VKRPLRHEELTLWAKVAATVRPAAGRVIPRVPAPMVMPVAVVAAKPKAGAAKSAATKPATPPAARKILPPSGPQGIEPGRLRRLTRERDGMGPRLDLHGLTQDEARARLSGFLARAHAEGWRAVMVITGKGSRGDGVLRRYTPEWLAAPDLAHIVAGVGEAHRRHGGEGALYVALKRRARE